MQMKGSYGRYALVGALLCALLAAWMNVRYLKAQEKRVEVLTVVKEVQPYTAIPSDAVKLSTIPQEAAPADALTDAKELEGQYSRALLVPNTVVRKAHLVDAGGSNLAARLAVEQNHEMRAMALQVNEATGVAGTLKEGDPVDILVAVKPQAREEKGQSKLPDGTLSRVIAQRVPVLFVQRNQEGGPGTVVLQVTPKTAEEIAFAQSNGMIWLLTSPYGQEGQPVETTGVDQQIFFDRYGIAGDRAAAAPAPEPKAAATGSGKSAPRSSGTMSGAQGGN
jgi:pilus assembly protein CpaB